CSVRGGHSGFRLRNLRLEIIVFQLHEEVSCSHALVVTDGHGLDCAGYLRAQRRDIGTQVSVVCLLRAAAPNPSVPAADDCKQNARRQQEEKPGDNSLKAALSGRAGLCTIRRLRPVAAILVNCSLFRHTCFFVRHWYLSHAPPICFLCCECIALSSG